MWVWDRLTYYATDGQVSGSSYELIDVGVPPENPAELTARQRSPSILHDLLVFPFVAIAYGMLSV